MKTTQIFRTIFILCLINFISCSKDSVDDNDSNTTTATINGTMQALIDGGLVLLKPSKFTGERVAGSNRSTYPCGYSMSIRVPLQLEENKTYTMKDGIYASLYHGGPSGGLGCLLRPSTCCSYSDSYESIEATLTFTQITSQNIKGKFSFLAKEKTYQNNPKEKVITDGSFNILRE